jgi:hypothetical protein
MRHIVITIKAKRESQNDVMVESRGIHLDWSSWTMDDHIPPETRCKPCHAWYGCRITKYINVALESYHTLGHRR